MLKKELTKFAKFLENNGVILFESDGKTNLHTNPIGMYKPANSTEYEYMPLAMTQELISTDGASYHMKVMVGGFESAAKCVNICDYEKALCEGKTLKFHAFVVREKNGHNIMFTVMYDSKQTGAIMSACDVLTSGNTALSVYSHKVDCASRNTESFILRIK